MAEHPPDLSRDEEQRSILRSVQRTGLTSLTVTLPKSWTEAFNIQNGSKVRLYNVGDGRLEVSPAAGSPAHSPPRTLEVDASRCPRQLLSRLLVGAYITGQDYILISSDREISAELRAEVDQIAHRMLGMSVIEDEPNRLEVRVFLDPTKHRLAGLVDRVVRMIRLELELFQGALRDSDRGSLDKIPALEEEIDRFYLLLARQILLASNDAQVAREIGVPSHHYQIGYRVVVKMLEVVADMLAAVANELTQDLALRKDAAELGAELAQFDATLVRSMDAFREVSALRAHEALTEIETWSRRRGALADTLIGRSRDKVAACRVQRILGNLGTARELLAIINETTINRAVEPETIARSGGRAVVAGA